MTEDSRIIIVDSENRVGLVVDDVTEFCISGGGIEPPPSTVAGLKAEYIQESAGGTGSSFC